AVGADYTRTTSVTLPLSVSLAPGDYYLLVQADGTGALSESNESNNVLASAAVALTLPPLPDLVVTSIDAPANGYVSQHLTLHWTVRNQGDGDATGTWRDNVFLAPNSAGTGGTFLGAFDFTGTLAAGASATRSLEVTLPGGLGDRWFVVATDANNNIYEHA